MCPLLLFELGACAQGGVSRFSNRRGRDGVLSKACYSQRGKSVGTIMRRPISVSFIIAALVPALGSSSSVANDSSAELSVGGLIFSRSDDVSVESEALKISPKLVSVRYQFFNRKTEPVTLTVAFPLPDIDLSEGEMLSLPDNDPTNFVGFKTRIDGKPINFTMQQNAYLGSKNVSATLRSLNIPILPIGAQHIDLADLPEATRNQLFEQGLLLKNGTDDKGRQLYEAGWTVKTAAVRKQTFAPNRPATVEHRYHPSVGISFDTVLRKGLRQNKAMAAEIARYRREYCIGDDFLAALDKLAGEAEHNAVKLQERRITYVLKTGANWAGPIKDFRLIVDKQKADRLVSFCAVQTRAISPTLVEAATTDFTPEKDLKILIVGRFEKEQIATTAANSTVGSTRDQPRSQKTVPLPVPRPPL
jgi:hypothetical protein